MTRFLTSEVGL